MADTLNKLSPPDLKAAMNSPGGFRQWGSAKHHTRYVDKIRPASRRRCHCGCKKRATHVGKANGIALTNGCELSMQRWVKTGSAKP